VNEIKEFWKKCGVQIHGLPTQHGLVFEYPDGKCSPTLPPIDLNNLFKYAVPKVGAVRLNYSLGTCQARVTMFFDNDEYDRYESEDKDPAQALYKALAKAFGLEE